MRDESIECRLWGRIDCSHDVAVDDEETIAINVRVSTVATFKKGCTAILHVSEDDDLIVDTPGMGVAAQKEVECPFDVIHMDYEPKL